MTSKTFRRTANHPLRLVVLGFIGILLLPATTWSSRLVGDAYIKASNTGTGDHFGYSVALSGNLLVVGAPNEAGNANVINGPGNNDLAPASGAAYVFVRDNSFRSQQAFLKASDAAAGDNFGRSVAASADTVVVGAPWKGGNAGAAYVFVRTGSSWTQQAILKGSDTVAGDYFGESVAVSGDTVVVGASGKESETGAAYVFVRSGNVWTQQGPPLKASNFEAFDRFGFSVAVFADTLVVGAYGEDGNGTAETDNSSPSAGAAYVYVRNGSTWTQQAYLKASNTDASDYFGEAVGLYGDTIVIGASGEGSSAQGVNGDETDNGASRAGAAYVFARSGSTWTQQAYLKASNTDADDLFGKAVALFQNTIVVGAWGEASRATGVDSNQGDNAAPQAGAAYVFIRQGDSWSQEFYLKASNTEAADYFGFAVAVSDRTIVGGAYGEDSSATGVNGNQTDDNAYMSGAAYFFEYPVVYLPIILNPTP